MIERILAEKAAVVDRGIMGVVGSDAGELREPMLHLIKAGGKRIRPVLCLLACECVGGKDEDALLPAVAIELIHNFSLVHDDIMDGDLLRRGRPTTHAAYGLPLAINAGDGLFAKAFCAIADSKLDATRKEEVLRIISKSVFEVCVGQALDMSFSARKEVSVGEYLDMVEKKTGVLLEAAAKAGAVCGGGSGPEIEALGKFAHNMGIAFQIQDDVIGVAGESKKTGKAVGNDIREGKKTIIVLHALGNLGGKDLAVLKKALGNRKATKKQIGDAINVLREAGSIEYAKNHAISLVKEAKQALGVFPDSEPKKLLLELCDFIVQRNH